MQDKSQLTKTPISRFQHTDHRNFIKACNQVCYFETADLQLYFSIVDIGFFLKEYVLLALKVKKGLNLYELALADHIQTTQRTLLPLQAMPTFYQLRRLKEYQEFDNHNKRIRVKFEGDQWKLLFKNKDLVLNWMNLLELATSNDDPNAFQQSLLIKELKRNYEYMKWRIANPNAISNLFDERLSLTYTFRQQMERTKRYVGVNANEIIGRMICERREKNSLKEEIEEHNRMNQIYKHTLYQITQDQMSVSNYV